jgi:CDP-diacylglycerol--glycerol-3-phosphate 3-phosphatidyltransferase
VKIRFNNLPLKITAARLLASPFLVLLFWLSVKGNGYGSPIPELAETLNPGFLAAALALLMGQEISDMVDGYLARKHKIVTNLGKIADPLADTIAHFGAYLCLMWVGVIPMWLLFLLYIREASVSSLRVLAASHGVVVAARATGKIKSFSLAIGANGLFAILLAAHYFPSIPVDGIATVVSWLLGAIIVLSLIDYYVAITKIRGRNKQGKKASKV